MRILHQEASKHANARSIELYGLLELRKSGAGSRP
jgi:hypothetical protein